MRKRRHDGGLNEAMQVLRTQLTAARNAQELLPASKAPAAPVPTPAPPGIDGLSMGSINKMSDEELQSFRSEIAESLVKTESELNAWLTLQKHLKSAMDAALMLTTLKADQPGGMVHKRRRHAASNSIDFAAAEIKQENTSAPEPEAAAASAASATPANATPTTSTSSTEATNAETTNADAPASSARSPSPTAAAAATSTSNAVSGADPSALEPGRQVAFKVPQTQVDEWIQCEITRVFANGQRFEVRDPEPDDMGNPGKTYQCRLKDIIPLPSPNQNVKPLSVGAVVLALYPETTAFYKARVASFNAKRGVYFLRFEGEEDAEREIEVKQQYVLPKRR